MKKSILCLVVAAAGSVSSATAQTQPNAMSEHSAAGSEMVALTAAAAYKTIPDYLMPLTSESTRLDMIDYFEAGLSTRSSNDYRQECYITELTPEVIRVVDGETMRYELFVLNADSRDPLIGVIETVLTPIPDSTVKFYTRKWVPVPKIAVTPKLADWMAVKGGDSRRQVEQTLPFIMASYTYDPSTQTLKVTNNMSAYYAPQDTPEALSLLKGELEYRWDGKKFKPVKQ